MLSESRIEKNYACLLQRIEAACERSQRPASAVKLVAVTKYAQLEWVQTLVRLGVRELGESRPQQLIERVPLIAAEVNWHLIGHLQRNKARRILQSVSLIHSVDSIRLLRALDRLADELTLRPRLLLEVNISAESAKHGFSTEELLADWKTVLSLNNLQVEGLMTMAPFSENPENARSVFRRLRELRDRLAERSPASVALTELSMGMSGDFEVAIEEGSTIVRIGGLLYAGVE